MSTETIREKLQRYIKHADEKKLHAIFTILEDEINTTSNWWDDDELIKELDQQYLNWKAGKDKGFSFSEIRRSVQALEKNGRAN
ncbi:MAG: hypothetical protein LH473_07630 [Chitinophagales bacterium]|nr:hypothetical protein [Chitinophagales bacterium]